jgi:hypothetical protein
MLLKKSNHEVAGAQEPTIVMKTNHLSISARMLLKMQEIATEKQR